MKALETIDACSGGWTVANNMSTSLKRIPAKNRRSLVGLLRRFARRQDGASTVEVGIVLLPFLGLLLMIIETAIVFFAGQTLETAVADSSRLVMTGQAQSGAWSQSDFADKVCTPAVKALFDCNAMYVDVRKYNAFSSVDQSVQLDANGKPITAYQPGGAGDIVVVRIIYQWPIIAPLVRTYLADPSSASRMLVATAAFRNEPY
jgi:Flp pilus assembly protein TadG